MKTTFEITKEQILEIKNFSDHHCHTVIESRLKQWFPTAFETELEVGKWYKWNDCCLAFIEDIKEKDFKGYGFYCDDVWVDSSDNWTNGFKNWELATDKEVETALINEAIKRGFKEGVKVKLLPHNYGNSKSNYARNEVSSGCFEYNGNVLHVDNLLLFSSGKWAEIIEPQIELTLEQIAEKFNVNVNNLKIKK